MIRGLGGKKPKIAESAFVSEAAYVVGMSRSEKTQASGPERF